MTRKSISWKTKGMNRDTSVSGFNSEFAFENYNLRLTTNEGNTMTSLVNERGTKELRIRIYHLDKETNKLSEDDFDNHLTGTPIGTAVINHRLIIFAHSDSADFIYALWKPSEGDNDSADFIGRVLYSGNLNFSIEHPLEPLISYESENIQKVYWTDGLNQPRVINVAPYMDAKLNRYNDTCFDFVPELQLKEEVKVTKIFGSGQFPAGVIQYAFTYYNKYGQESCIFHTTPLQYISYADRGGSADSVIANSFRIEITGVDTRFDYLRVYSILRTTVDATPYTKRVQDIEISDKDTVTFTDDGVQGDTIDPTELLYKGGEEITAETMEQKDGTLFLGNIKIKRPPIIEVRNALYDYSEIDKNNPLANERLKSCRYHRYYMLASKGELKYVSTLSGQDETVKNRQEYLGASCFKSREYYRLGVQFQYKTGKWSEPCWIGDKQQRCVPEVDGNYMDSGIRVPEFRYYIDDYLGRKEGGFYKYLYGLGYRKIRPVFAAPKFSDRTILCQGGVCPTMYRQHDRNSGKLWAQSSWLFRVPLKDEKDTPIENALKVTDFTNLEDGGGRVTCALTQTPLVSQYANPTFPKLPVAYDDKTFVRSPYLRSTEIMGVFDDEHIFSCDTNIITVHSPEFIFDTSMASVDCKGCKLRTIGEVHFTKTYGDIDIQTETPAIGSNSAGFVHRAITTEGNAALITGLFYNDYLVDDDNSSTDTKYSKYSDSKYAQMFPVYMWHKNGSLNNDVNRSNRSAELKKKRISNYRLGATTEYFVENSELYDDPAFVKWEDDYGRFGNYVKYPNYSGAPDISDSKWDSKITEWMENRINNGDYVDFVTCDANSRLYYYSGGDALEMQLFDNNDLSIVKVNGNVYMGNIETMLTPTEASPFYFVGDPWRKEQAGDPEYSFAGDVVEYRLSLRDPNNEDSKNGVWKIQEVTSGMGNKVETFWDWSQNKDWNDVGNTVKGLVNWREPISMKYKSTAHMVVNLGKLSDISPETIFHNAKASCMPLVEIYKDRNAKTLYGGTSDDAMMALNWIPCGPAVSFDDNTTGTLLEFKWGDSYVQRFECLKTYPFTSEDKNQVIEIASFICETRINIDGRYDRNRAQTSNLNMTPQNFNLLNPVYSQMDNFFTYKTTDTISYLNIDFPNNITWTKTKQNGADVDLWTNITIASVLELDGDKGEITKIARLNNQLIAFQDRGISQILYNESAQIAASEGVTLELANSGKVQGKRYVSDTVGCSNKWSIVQTPSGIYFMDSFDKSIYRFTGELANLSTAGGFNSWAKQNIPSPTAKWNPESFNNFIAYYDKLNQDVLFINKDTALAFSEKLNCFTSFYDYGSTPFFESIEDTEVWIKDEHLWEHQAGEYCNFFDKNKPFSMTLIANQESQLDKIFTNLEFRASVEGDGIENEGKFIPELPIDSIETWDEYQHGLLALSNRNKGDRIVHGSSEGILNRKFRIWRCDIPRDNAPVDAESESKNGIKRTKRKPLDRMRNTWIYLKLKKEAAENKSISKTEIHDIMVSYFS